MKKQNGKNEPVDREKLLRIADTVRAVTINSVLETKSGSKEQISHASECGLTESEKEAYVRARFENIDDNDLVDGKTFFDSLELDNNEDSKLDDK